jgi:hypothetical protein
MERARRIWHFDIDLCKLAGGQDAPGRASALQPAHMGVGPSSQSRIDDVLERSDVLNRI